MEGNELYDEGFANAAANSSNSGNIGSGAYVVDNSSFADFSGSQVDNSTNIGLQGKDLSNLLGSVTAIASQSVGAMSETANRLVENSQGSDFIAQYKTPILLVVGGGLLLFIAKQFKII